MSAITLQPGRTWLLMRNNLSMARTPAIMIAAASGVALILYVLTSIGDGSSQFHLVVYPIMLILFGYIISSFSFQEIHDPRAGVYEERLRFGDAPQVVGTDLFHTEIKRLQPPLRAHLNFAVYP